MKKKLISTTLIFSMILSAGIVYGNETKMSSNKLLEKPQLKLKSEQVKKEEKKVKESALKEVEVKSGDTKKPEIAVKEGWLSKNAEYIAEENVKFSVAVDMISKAIEIPDYMKIGKEDSKYKDMSFNLSDNFMEERKLDGDTQLTREDAIEMLMQQLATALPITYSVLDGTKYIKDVDYINASKDLSNALKITNITKEGEWEKPITMGELVKYIIDTKEILVNAAKDADSKGEVWTISFEYQNDILVKYKKYGDKKYNFERKRPGVHENVREVLKTVMDDAIKGDKKSEWFINSTAIVNSMKTEDRDVYMNILKKGDLKNLSAEDKNKISTILGLSTDKAINDAMSEISYYILLGYGKRTDKSSETSYQRWLQDRIDGSRHYWVYDSEKMKEDDRYRQLQGEK